MSHQPGEMIGEIDHQAHFLHKLKTLKELKIELPKDPYILDYCCGAGSTVYGISDLGFKKQVPAVGAAVNLNFQ